MGGSQYQLDEWRLSNSPEYRAYVSGVLLAASNQNSAGSDIVGICYLTEKEAQRQDRLWGVLIQHLDNMIEGTVPSVSSPPPSAMAITG